jgi:hypothetical protein
MLIALTDPDNSDIFGELFNADLVLDDALQGTAFNLFFSSTGSHDNTELFDLSEPPSFFGPHMVWGSVDQEGTLNLFLAPTTGDATHPFAQLHNFQNLSGQADLTRSNKLPSLVKFN